MAVADPRRVRELTKRIGDPPSELLAAQPNQVWSWDITELLAPVKWTYYYLCVVL